MQITPGVHSLEQDKGGNVHAFLLDDGQGLTLIDTLYDDGNVVLAEIAAMGRTPADLKQIILTHAHKSHLGVQMLTDFGSADILGVGHGPPITRDAAARVRELAR